MSWAGIHPEMSRVEARRLLKPGSCRLCVAWLRVHPKDVEKLNTEACHGCGGRDDEGTVKRALTTHRPTWWKDPWKG